MDTKESIARNEDFRAELAKHLNALRGWGKTLTKSLDEADELVQQTFLEALKSEESFIEGSQMQSWLFTILKRLWYKSLEDRKQNLRSVQIDGEISDFEQNLTVQPPQENVLHAQEAHRAMDTLSTEHREVLFFVSIRGFSYEEAAKICGVEVGTIRSRVYRAKLELLKAYEGGLGSIVEPEIALSDSAEQKKISPRRRTARIEDMCEIEIGGESEQVPSTALPMLT